MKLSSDMTHLVEPEHLLIDAELIPPPKGIVMLCGNKYSGKTVLSQWHDDYGFTHYYPLPVFPRYTEASTNV